MDIQSSNQPLISTCLITLVYSNYLFDILYEFSYGTNLPPIPPRLHDSMAGTGNSVEGFLTELLTPILPNIVGELIRQYVTKTHKLINGNAASVASNLGGFRHGHLTLTMTVEEYLAQTG